jgi:hypothetical protein
VTLLVARPGELAINSVTLDSARKFPFPEAGAICFPKEAAKEFAYEVTIRTFEAIFLIL